MPSKRNTKTLMIIVNCCQTFVIQILFKYLRDISKNFNSFLTIVYECAFFKITNCYLFN